MNKPLLLGTALLVAISAYPQNGKLGKPSGITNSLEKGRTVINEGTGTSVNTAPVKQVTRPTSAAKTSATAATSCVHFSGSSNVFGFYQGGHEALQYNKELNAVSFVHRSSPTYSSVPNGNSGTIVTKWTTNNGTSWDSTVIWANTTNLGRYPQGGLYNPTGNTNINNAYAVGMGETVQGSGFNGNWFASKQLSTPGTMTGGADQQFFSNTAPFGTLGKKVDFVRYGFTFTQDGKVRGLGEIVNDINDVTSNLGRGERGDAVLKGTFSAGSFTWSYDSLIPPTILRTDGSKQFTTHNNLMAWNDAGTIGYVVMIGARAGTSGAMKGYQPIVYKTTNSGTSWALLPANDFTTPQFGGLVDRLWATNSNTNLVVPFFSSGESMDAAVDVNGNLHIATTVVGAYSNDNDSLEYTVTWGTDKYAFPYFANVFPTIYDFYTTSSGWGYHIVDSMGTEGPAGTSTGGGFGVNPWAAAAVPLDARIQMSFSADRTKMFYSWTESDTSTTSNHWNIYPDIKMKGYDVTIDKVTPRVNITTGVTTPSNADQQAYFHFMANRAILTNSALATNEIPFTISYNGANDGNAPTNHYYLKGASFTQTDFNTNPLRPLTGIASLTNNTPKFDVINYPNPADDFTTVSVNLKESNNFEINVYNTVGQLIQTIKANGKVGNNDVNLDLSNLSAGVYVYNVKVGNASVTKKLIVQ